MTLYLIIGAGLIAVLYGIITRASLMKASTGNERMNEIAGAIQEGAKAYLNKQYKTIAIVGVVVTILLALLFKNAIAPVGFVIGAVLSGIAGYVGMLVSVQANVRTTEASRGSLGAGLNVAFKAGAITGMLVAGLALLGLAVYYMVLTGPMGADARGVIDGLVSLSLGASLISVFARLGGGIFRDICCDHRGHNGSRLHPLWGGWLSRSISNGDCGGVYPYIYCRNILCPLG